MDRRELDQEQLTRVVCAILSSTGGEQTARSVVKLAHEVCVEIEQRIEQVYEDAKERRQRREATEKAARVNRLVALVEGRAP